MSYFVEAMIDLCPTQKWQIIGEELHWFDDIDLKPSTKQIEEKIVELKQKQPMKLLREQRNEKLLETDKYFIYDWPFKNEEERNAWLLYRKQLRELPSNSNPQLDNGILINVQWPIKPY